MADNDSEENSVGRPPKKDKDKYGGAKQVTLKPAQWERVNAYLEANDLDWMEFVRSAIFDKLDQDDS